MDGAGGVGHTVLSLDQHAAQLVAALGEVVAGAVAVRLPLGRVDQARRDELEAVEELCDLGFGRGAN